MRHLLIALMLAGPAMAQDEVTGERIFGWYCSACHGEDARGNGPMSPVLLVQPANLTTLKARNGGTFPVWRVISRIDGRDPLVSHGSDMPVFGPWFQGEPASVLAENGQPVLTSKPIVQVLEYLEGIQE